jgi:hypothetical protein
VRAGSGRQLDAAQRCEDTALGMDPAEIIDGRFEVELLAGSGGMGKVYRARDRVSGERVAVKVLRQESVERARFEREGALLAELAHPGIVRYVAHGRTREGALYIAMQWLDGEDLSQRLKRRELSLEEAVSVGLHVGEALGAAHRRGIVHRDVKPGNVFLVDRSADDVKLLDFGIARVLTGGHPLTHTGLMIGTPGFMSPEQARGEREIGPPADVFALGCVVFRCVTGRPPFAGEDVLATLLKVALEEAPRARSLRPDVPDELDELIARMLAKSPRSRLPDGDAVASAFGRLGEAAASERRAPPSSSGVTSFEQRLLCVLVARAAGVDDAPGSATAPTFSDPESGELEMAAVAEHHGGELHLLVDGSLFVTMAGAAAGTDQAVKAARCALSMRAILPGISMVLVAGRAVVSGRVPMGDAIDRGVAMLHQGSADEVRIDDVIAGLLDARFEVRSDETGRYLLGERDPAEATRPLLGRRTACVGRDPELLQLGSVLEESITERVAQAVLVTAPPGMGKSRLCHEFLRAVRDRWPAVQIWFGRADLMSAGAPFALVGSVIRRVAGVTPGDGAAARRQKILDCVGVRVTGPAVARVADVLGEIAAPMGGRAPRLAGDGPLQAWLDWLRAETARVPLLIALEDLHWGDLPSLHFIDAALRELSDRPIMVLATARPELHERIPLPWARRPLMEVKLGALSRRASERFARRMLGEAVPDAVVEAVVTRGAGNPFYLEELIRAVAEGRGDALPETILAMAEARLDALDPESRRVLRAASVFGEVFWKGGVAEVLGGADPAALGQKLAELTRGELIERHGDSRFPNEEEFAFRHVLVRDAAYAMLPDEDRELGHALAAAWLAR